MVSPEKKPGSPPPNGSVIRVCGLQLWSARLYGGSVGVVEADHEALAVRRGETHGLQGPIGHIAEFARGHQVLPIGVEDLYVPSAHDLDAEDELPDIRRHIDADGTIVPTAWSDRQLAVHDCLVAGTPQIVREIGAGKKINPLHSCPSCSLRRAHPAESVSWPR